jgi:hypothetical protein
MRHYTHVGVSAAALVLAGRFAEPGGDLLTGIEGLTREDVQFVVDTVNPYERLAPGGLLGDFLFPGERTDALEFSYLRGAGRGAVMAHVAAQAGEAPIAGRPGVSRISGQIPAIKQKRTQGPETLIRLQSLDGTVRGRIVGTIYDDVTAGRLGVYARLEKLRMDALFTGIASSENEEGIVFSVNYGVPSGHQETLSGTDLWSDPASKPIENLREWQNLMIADTGQRMETVYAPAQVLQALAANPSVRKALFGTNSERMATMADVNALLSQQDLPQFAPSYDLIVQREKNDGSREAVRLVPSDRIVLTPGRGFGALGRTFQAPTAEEATQQVASGTIAIDPNRVATHVYVATQDPKNLVTLATASSFPSFEAAEYVFQAKVL